MDDLYSTRIFGTNRGVHRAPATDDYVEAGSKIQQIIFHPHHIVHSHSLALRGAAPGVLRGAPLAPVPAAAAAACCCCPAPPRCSSLRSAGVESRTAGGVIGRPERVLGPGLHAVALAEGRETWCQSASTRIGLGRERRGLSRYAFECLQR
eukprot:4741034-Pleurochrysis_carterae.AAC.4